MPVVALVICIIVSAVSIVREMRFPPGEIMHLGSRFVKNEIPPDEWENRNTAVLRFRDARIIFLTVAFVSFFTIPFLSVVCSFAAMFLMILNCSRVSYTKVRTEAYEDGDGEAETDRIAEEPDRLPALYDTWSESRQYLYRIRQRMQAAKEIESEVNKAVATEFPEGTIQIERDLLKPGNKIDDTVILPAMAGAKDTLKETISYLESIGNGD